MIWLAWRQFRISAAAVLLVVVAVGVTAASTASAAANHDAPELVEFLYGGGALVMFAFPVIIGLFWGVPMITRELETGTHTLVWNQTVTRTRWLTVKLAFGTLGAMAAAGLLSLAVTWWANPIDATGGTEESTFEPRLSPLVFVTRGVVPVGYTAFAFVLGIALGMLLRRTVTAMAVTLVVFAAVQVLVPFAVRPHLLPATDTTVPITAENIRGIRAEPGEHGDVPVELHIAYPDGAWLLSNETVDPQGNPVTRLPAEVGECLPPAAVGPAQDWDRVHTCFARLSDLGYRQHLVYQPDSHFWPLQWAETGFFLALSGLLGWVCFRRVRQLS